MTTMTIANEPPLGRSLLIASSGRTRARAQKSRARRRHRRHVVSGRGPESDGMTGMTAFAPYSLAWSPVAQDVPGARPPGARAHRGTLVPRWRSWPQVPIGPVLPRDARMTTSPGLMTAPPCQPDCPGRSRAPGRSSSGTGRPSRRCHPNASAGAQVEKVTGAAGARKVAGLGPPGPAHESGRSARTRATAQED